MTQQSLSASEQKTNLVLPTKAFLGGYVRAKQRLREGFETAGIEIDGKDPWDIQVNDDRFYSRVLTKGSIGLGETYVQGWWDCKQVDEAIRKIMESDLEHHFMQFRQI